MLYVLLMMKSMKPWTRFYVLQRSTWVSCAILLLCTDRLLFVLSVLWWQPTSQNLDMDCAVQEELTPNTGRIWEAANARQLSVQGP